MPSFQPFHQSNQPKLNKNHQFLSALTRSRFLLFIVFCLFLSLIGRLVWITFINHPFYQKESKKNAQRTLKIPAFRGKIYDRDNNLLATSLENLSFWLEPDMVEPKQEAWKQTIKLLNLPDNHLNGMLKKYASKDFVYLKRQVEPEVAKKILAFKLQGLHIVREPKRYYTQGEVMAQILGFTSLEHKGQEGIELFFNKDLTGKAGKKRIIRDGKGRTIDLREEKNLGIIMPAQDGKDLVLSIDAHIQNETFKALKEAVTTFKAKLGTAVILNAKTGEVLAMASWPSYDPNQLTINKGNMRNHGATDVFEPGSTIKPISIAMALNEGTTTANANWNTNSLQIGKITLRDEHPHSNLSTLEVIQKSSNVGTSKITYPLKPSVMWNYYQQLGFGQVPKLQFPGSAKGILRPAKTWLPIEKATMSYGYGLSASILQLTQAYTVFANEGKFVPATFYKVNQIPSGYSVFKPEVANSIKQGLEMVTQKGGTALKAQVNGYRVGGKTGTAQINAGNGYGAGHRGFFVGIAPISNPQIAVGVMLSEPSTGVYYGGEIAAPVFARITDLALRHMNIPFDKTEPTEAR